MDAAQRIVIGLPLAELWTNQGALRAQRAERIGATAIVELLLDGSSFVVADVGKPLRWIPSADRFDFWRVELKCRLVPPDVDRFDLDAYPGGYCYLASVWRDESSSPIIVLETHH
ncbi:hypothetical protein [Bradyrhizobium guangxiense]|uniref:hypothetical protein n=1 Tax=Bradyrhizobium guangxiense TaxID=1325115 RepID=UPI001008CAF2|nr:hypothetical protein [Bradyrhizobium guangxiense]